MLTSRRHYSFETARATMSWRNIAARRLALLLMPAMLTASAEAGTLFVTGLSPARHSMTPSLSPAIEITFDRPVNPATITSSSFHVFSDHIGPLGGAVTLESGGTVLRFVPNRACLAGDLITVSLSHAIAGADGSPLRSAGYAYQFLTAARRSTHVFTQTQEFSVEDFPGEFPRIYGGQASDLNRDGWVDLAIVCENAADIRVYPNLADGSGDFGPRLIPSATTDALPSPNVAADFNNDGLIDIATGNYDGHDVTIVLGTGDGHFTGRTDIPLGGESRGIAAFDFDGDGDQDIVCSVPGMSRVALMTNNGTGGFASPVFIEGGGNAEYGLCAADMNNDGILDLVVGNRDSSTITVMRGNGNGTFTLVNTQSSGGPTWVVVCGDVNGDGNIDVAAANSGAGNNAILRGNGNGTLQAPVTYNVSGHTPAVDLADLDGDGDLDMLSSSFGGGLWRLFVNNGAGSFTFVQDYDAASNPACAILVDVNNDRTIDMVHLDEIAQLVRIWSNTPLYPDGDMNCDTLVDNSDIDAFVLALLDPAGYHAAFPACDILNADTNGDGVADNSDIDSFVTCLLNGGCS